MVMIASAFVLPNLVIHRELRHQYHPSSSSRMVLSISSTSTTRNSNNNQTEKKSTKKKQTHQRNQQKYRVTSRSLAVEALVSSSPNYPAVQILDQKLQQNQSIISEQDKKFARLLISTVERHLGQIDSILSQFTRSDTNKKYKSIVQACLRIGVAQLLFIGTPPHAAIGETVEVLKYIQIQPSRSRQGQGRGKGSNTNVPKPLVQFTNAVLRNILRAEEKARKNNNDENDNHSTSSLSVLASQTDMRDNLSPWFLNQLEKDYGTQITNQMISHFINDFDKYIDLSIPYPPPVITKDSDNHESSFGNRNEYIEYLISQFKAFSSSTDISTTVLPNDYTLRIRNMGGSLKKWPLFNDGIYWVQDVSASLPAISLLNAIEKQRNTNTNNEEIVLVDMCSAPGGKTAQLLSHQFSTETSKNSNTEGNTFPVHVHAIEASSKRAKTLKENLCDRLTFPSTSKVSIHVTEGQNWVLPQKTHSTSSSIDGILLDIPCSASGTASKRPDVLRKDYQSVLSGENGLLEIQQVLLRHCADNLLDENGVLVFATCSILKQESEDQVHKLLQRTTSTRTNTKEMQEKEGWRHTIKTLYKDNSLNEQNTSVEMLKDYLRHAGQKVSGKKIDLIQRVKDYMIIDDNNSDITQEDKEIENNSIAEMITLPFEPGEIPGFDNAIDENGWLRVLPGTLPGELKYCDGFFVARLVRINSR